jgi:SPP1 family predicted phage head-tail adaptor
MVKRTHTGEFNRRVDIYQQESGTTPNADGQVVESPELLARRWAKRRAVRGMEKFGDQQVEADTTYLVWVKYDEWTKTLTPKMWLRFNDEVRLNIVRAFDPNDDQYEIMIECRDRIGDDD